MIDPLAHRAAVLRTLATVLVLAGAATAGHATITPASMFTDNAVLQQRRPVPVWGTAEPNEPIAVSIDGQTVNTTASVTGQWSVRLAPIPAGGPYSLTIAGSPGDSITLSNILVGEVWICSGQSNMEYPMMGWAQPAITRDAIATSADPLLHFIKIDHTVGLTPQTWVNGQWKEATVDTVPHLTAVGYFFGRDLRKALNVPVGLIDDDWGGTPAQAWTSRPALTANPALAHYLDEESDYEENYPKLLDTFNDAQAKYLADKATYDSEVAAGTKGLTAPTAPHTPDPPDRWPNGASHLYNGMIAPVIPYAIRGAIWYQGESNTGNAYDYKTLFPAMITDWRKNWGEGDFPFLFVQLAPYTGIRPSPVDGSWWAELREAQRLTLAAVPNAGMAVITDLGDQNDVHPRRKEPVGDRLALAARALVYRQRIAYTGPVLAGIKIEGGAVRVKFSHAKGLHAVTVHDSTDDGPLVASADKLVGFEVAGSDRKYHAANATIDGASVVVSSPDVTVPVAVRYGWADYPVANLSNNANLPASPFKTDDWPWTTEPTTHK
ncbi:MAG: sialate O-acetylesterase [Capsulimonadaceae bacterium]